MDLCFRSRAGGHIRQDTHTHTPTAAPHQLQVELQIFVLQHGIHTLHLVSDPTLGVVQALDEVVPVLGHQVGETEEGVCFSVLWPTEQRRTFLVPTPQTFIQTHRH